MNVKVEKLAEDLMAADGVSTIPEPVDGAGGKIKKRLADLDKAIDPKADTLEKPPLTEEEKKGFDFSKLKKSKDKDSDSDNDDDNDEDDSDKKDGKKAVMKEDSPVLKVFEGVELADETKRKLSVVFEAAVIEEAESLVEAKLAATKVALKESHDAEVAALKEAHATEMATLEENLKTFMEDTSNKWLEENKIAIQDAKTVEIAEAFVNSIKDLFVEHAVNVDVDSAATITALEEEIESANSKANAAILERLAMKKELNEMKTELIFAEISEGLTTSQTEKFKTLSKKIVMEDIEQFKSDLTSIKETFFADTTITIKEEKEETALINEAAKPQVLSEDYVVNNIVNAINARKNQ